MISKIIGNQEKPVSNSGDSLGSSVTLTGNPLSFSKDTAGLASNTVIALEPIQAGTGDPSPSNVRAISGYEKVEVVVPRKNWFNKNIVEYGAFNPSTGDPAETTDYKRIRDIIVRPNTTYTISGLVDPENRDNRVFLYDEQHNYLTPYLSFNTSEYTFTTPANCKYLSARWYATTNISNAQIELGSTATAYEPYNPLTDLSIAMPGTVYGGTLDVESGELVVDRGMVTYNGSEDWTTSSKRFIILRPSIFASESVQLANITNLLSNQAYRTYDDVYGAYFSIGNSYIFVNALDSSENITAFKARLASNPIQIIGTLATPITYHLTPHQVALLQGANVVSTNGTSISLTHRQGQIAAQSDLIALAESVNGMDKGSVSVTADGVKTFGTLLGELKADLDFDKLNYDSVLIIGNHYVSGRDGVTRYEAIYIDGENAVFALSNLITSSNTLTIRQIKISPSSNSYYTNAGGNVTDNTNDVLSSSHYLKIIY